ncbi:MAG: protein kinase [Kineosporiaceae bacterium]
MNRDADLRLGPPELPGYEYVRPLGTGGFSDVYLYRQEMPRREVAVKVLLRDSVGVADRSRFSDEANLTASLASHPSIVTIHHADVAADGRPYLVMEYYPSENLRVRSSRERLRVETVVSYGIQIACAVETAHRAGILHRDIKPANILVNQYDIPGLADFGIAATLAEAASESDEDSGLSIPWSPPEVLRSARASNELSDVWSLGATLYTLLVGRSPFELPGGRNTSGDLMRRIETEPPQPLDRPDVPASLERLILQSLAKTPAARPASALAMAQALQAVEGEMGLPVTPLVVVQQYRSLPRETPETDDGSATRLRTPGAKGAGPEQETDGTVLRGDRTRRGRAGERAAPEAPAPVSRFAPRPPGAPEPDDAFDSATVRRPLDLREGAGARTPAARVSGPDAPAVMPVPQAPAVPAAPASLPDVVPVPPTPGPGGSAPVSPAERTPELEPTLRRRGAGEDASGADAAGPGARRIVLLVAGALAVLAAVVGGALALQGRGEDPVTPEQEEVVEPDSPLVDTPPAVTGLVLSKGAGGTWTARWSPPPGDPTEYTYQYQWQVDGQRVPPREVVAAPTAKPVPPPSLSGLRPPKGDSVCLEIFTVRGSRASQESATKCLPAAR